MSASVRARPGREQRYPVQRALLVWIALQACYQLVPDVWLATTLFPRLLVAPAAWLATCLGVGVETSGNALSLAGANLFVVRGCDGSDVLCALLALVAASPAPRPARLRAALLGCLLVHGLNLLRLTWLCWLAERRPLAFAMVHEWLAPALLVSLVGIAWWRWHLRQLRACALAAMTMHGNQRPPASSHNIIGNHPDPA